MTLAIMTRASLGHMGREIRASILTIAIYVLVTLGALARVAAPFNTEHMMTLLIMGGTLWSGAFALFVIGYGPILVLPEKGRI